MIQERAPLSNAPKIVVYCNVKGCIYNIQGCCSQPMSLMLSPVYTDDPRSYGKITVAACTPTYQRDWEKHGLGDKLIDGKFPSHHWENQRTSNNL